MHKLVSYVSAIKDLSSPVAVVRRTLEEERWIDQGFEVQRALGTYWFDNGVVVRRIVEQDSFPTELACAECWISYEVLSHGDLAEQIVPLRQSFTNACRESFWLSYHRA